MIRQTRSEYERKKERKKLYKVRVTTVIGAN